MSYTFERPSRLPRVLRSPIKDFLGTYEPQDVDLIEAVLSPIRTSRPWIYTCGDFQTAAAFNLLGAPLPLPVRMAYLRHLFVADNCRRIVFRSEAGRRSIETYGRVHDRRVLDKTTVVYPAAHIVEDAQAPFRTEATSLLFSGDFFRKGGANVVDAFERIQDAYPGVRLTLCCAPEDFRTRNAALRQTYVDRVHRNPRITVTGRLPRAEFVSRVLMAADVYLMPSYVESFGFAILEAMARGVPVISTNYFAIPEMIDHGVDGLLVDTARFDCDRLFRGYRVDDIPAEFGQHVTDSVAAMLTSLLDDVDERRRLGLAAREKVRRRYSFDVRNERMRQIYDEALA